MNNMKVKELHGDGEVKHRFPLLSPPQVWDKDDVLLSGVQMETILKKVHQISETSQLNSNHEEVNRKPVYSFCYIMSLTCLCFLCGFLFEFPQTVFRITTKKRLSCVLKSIFSFCALIRELTGEEGTDRRDDTQQRPPAGLKLDMLWFPSALKAPVWTVWLNFTAKRKSLQEEEHTHRQRLQKTQLTFKSETQKYSTSTVTDYSKGTNKSLNSEDAETSWTAWKLQDKHFSLSSLKQEFWTFLHSCCLTAALNSTELCTLLSGAACK